MTRFLAGAFLVVLCAASACGGNGGTSQGGTTVYLLNTLRQNLTVGLQGPHQPAIQVTLVTTDQGNLGPTTSRGINAQAGDAISLQASAGTVTGPALTCTVTQATVDCGGVVMIVGTNSASCENWWAEYTGTPPNADCVAQ